MEYEAYFRKELQQQGYESEAEAIADIRALVDLSLNLMFEMRNTAGERLEMRGVVITPQEFEAARKDWTLEARSAAGNPASQVYQKEVIQAFHHIGHRVSRSSEAGSLPRVHAIEEELHLTRLEQFCFYLALVVDYDRKYERIYGYIQDNVGARLPTVGLGLSLYGMLAPGEEAWLGSDSPLWKYLFQDIKPEEEASKLSRPMAIREEVTACLRGRKEESGDWKRAVQMGEGGRRVRLVYGWEDLILEESQKDLLRQICDQNRYRDQVMKTWGLERKSPYGNGISAVFYGAPGTGKTMAAQVMGRELGMEICKVDLSQTVSKYIGETEKNLDRMFRQAKEYNMILFFDEADSLFSRRTEVSGSNDRYANMETGYLLQQFEEFSGIAILATNLIHNIDDAFKRRLRFFVRFTFPDKDMRLKLWETMIPAQMPVEEPLQFSRFAARFELSGSDIREVVTNAAYLAAARGRGLKNEDIREALRVHYLKLGKKLGEAEL